MFEKRRFYIAYNGEETRVKAPDGWSEDNLAFPQSEDFDTIFRTLTFDKLRFTTDNTADPIGGAAVLKNIFDAKAGNAEASLRIEGLKKYNYSTIFNGVFNFSAYRYNHTNKTVEIAITDSARIEKLTTRKDQTINTAATETMDGETVVSPTKQTVRLRKQDIVKRFEADMAVEGIVEFGAERNDIEDTFGATDTRDVPIGAFNFAFGIGHSATQTDYGSYKSPPQNTEIVGSATAALETPIVIPDDVESACFISLKALSSSFTIQTLDFGDMDCYQYIKHSRLGVLWGSTDSFQIQDEELDIELTGVDSILPALSEVPMVKGDTLVYGSYFDQVRDAAQVTISDVVQAWELEIVTSANSATNKTTEHTPTTSLVLQNDFGGEVTAPDGDPSTLYTHEPEYSAGIDIEMEAADINIKSNGIGNDFTFNVTGRVVHFDREGIEKNSFLMYSGGISEPVDEADLSGSAMSETWVFAYQDYLKFELLQEMAVTGDNMMEITLEGEDFNFKFNDSPPADSMVETFEAIDLLRYAFEMAAGVGCFEHEEDIDSEAKKWRIESSFRLTVSSGRGVRGFSLDDNPLDFSLLDLYTSIANRFGYRVTYSTSADKFTLRKFENVWGQSTVELGEVSNLEEFMAPVAKELKVGDQRVPDLDDFYLQYEGHNPTSYNFPSAIGRETVELRSPVSASSIELEILRRYNTAETTNLSLKSDDKLFFIKCHDSDDDGLISEKQERVEVYSPDTVGDVNLCMLPSWTLYRNRESIGRTFYKEPSSLFFAGAKNRVDIQTLYYIDLGYLKEQTDIASSKFEDIKDPVVYEFERPVDDGVLEALASDPNALISFEHKGETFEGYLYADTKLGLYLRGGKWSVIKKSE